jgi:hypothetical protein
VVADWRRGQLGWAATLPSLLLLLEEGSRAGNNQKEEEKCVNRPGGCVCFARIVSVGANYTRSPITCPPYDGLVLKTEVCGIVVQQL